MLARKWIPFGVSIARDLLIDISGIENLHLSPSPNTQCSKIRIYQVFLIQ